MKGKFKKIAAAFAAVTVLAGSFTSVAWADTYTTPPTDTTAISKPISTTATGDAILEKSLAIEGDANIPASSFTFTATVPTATAGAPYVAKGNGTTTVSVYQGLNPSSIKWTYGSAAAVTDDDWTMTFETQTKATASATGATNNGADISVVDNTTSYIATKKVALDFTGCGFTEPGIYRYTIAETGTNHGISNDANARTLDVYVEDDGTAASNTSRALKITGYVLYNGVVTTAPNVATGTAGSETTGEDGATTWIPDGSEAGTKSTGFLNTYTTTNLSFGKKVKGNQSSKDKYFKFDLVIKNANPATTYTLDGDYVKTEIAPDVNAATQSIAAAVTNPQVITTDGNGNATVSFYLKDGEYVTVLGLPYDTTAANNTDYQIYEYNEDYKASYNTTDITDTTEPAKTGIQNLTEWLAAADTAALVGATLTQTNPTDGKVGVLSDTKVTSADIEYAFLNEREGVIPTGIIMSVAPAAVVGIGVLAAIIAMIIAGKRRELEEE